MQVNNQFERITGANTLSDCSFVVECNSENHFIQSLCSIKLHVPPLNEQFLSGLIVKQSNVTQKWAKQFVQGMVEVHHILPPSLQSNYTIIYKINQHRRMLQQAHQSSLFHKITYMVSLYESGGYDFEQTSKRPEILDVLTKNIDNQFDIFNVHSYIQALKNLEDIDQQELENINEQLASLCMLNKLQVNNSANEQEEFDPTPWSDSQAILEKDFNIYQSWYSYIMQEGLSNAKRTVKGRE